MSGIIGQSLGRYHVLEQLGQGGMATVYKAFDTRLERIVVAKVILQQTRLDEKFIKRFEIEAKTLAHLSHPNIVKVLDYGDQDGLPYLVMEYIPGGTLKTKLGQPMDWCEAAQLLAPIARALGHAHSVNIVHRDVKPANILLTEAGVPMLTDFGIAKLLEPGQNQELTGTGMSVGTPAYMSPEQGLGMPVDHRADIYALGVVFFELVTGRAPFIADTPMAVLLKHVHDPLPRPKSVAPFLPDEVETVLVKAMSKRPEDRYQTMQEFATVLERLGRGAAEPVVTTGSQADAASASAARASATGTARVRSTAVVEADATSVGEVGASSGALPISGAMPAAKRKPIPASLWLAGALAAVFACALCAGAGALVANRAGWFSLGQATATATVPGEATLSGTSAPLASATLPAAAATTSATATQAPTPTATMAASATQAATATPTDTIAPTDTPTDTPAPTETPTPTRAATARPRRTATPKPATAVPATQAPPPTEPPPPPPTEPPPPPPPPETNTPAP
jgi:tRNA A-37 threonylcarbamoyl transferase component Bud32